MLFKEDLRGPLFLRGLIRMLNGHSRAFNNTRGVGAVMVAPNEHGGLDISARPGSLVVPRPFGISGVNSTTRKVTLRDGLILHGLEEILVTPPSGGVLVAGGTLAAPTYGALRYVYATRAASILSATVTSRPVPTREAWQMPLFAARIEGGQVIIQEVLWDSVLPLPGVYSSP
jgi:hypothetical protein